MSEETDLLSIAFEDGVSTERARLLREIDKIIEQINQDGLADDEIISLLQSIVERPPF